MPTMNVDSIKEVLGNSYLEPILEHLQDEGFTSSKGKPLTKKIVFHIIHGNTIAHEIQEAIINFVVAKRKKKKKLLSKLD